MKTKLSKVGPLDEGQWALCVSCHACDLQPPTCNQEALFTALFQSYVNMICILPTASALIMVAWQSITLVFHMEIHRVCLQYMCIEHAVKPIKTFLQEKFLVTI